MNGDKNMIDPCCSREGIHIVLLEKLLQADSVLRLCPKGDILIYIETVTKYRQLGINLIIRAKLDFQILT